MELASVASGLAAADPTGTIGTSVLRSVNNLAETQTAILFSSIGLGANVNALA